MRPLLRPRARGRARRGKTAQPDRRPLRAASHPRRTPGSEYQEARETVVGLTYAGAAAGATFLVFRNTAEARRSQTRSRRRWKPGIVTRRARRFLATSLASGIRPWAR